MALVIGAVIVVVCLFWWFAQRADERSARNLLAPAYKSPDSSTPTEDQTLAGLRQVAHSDSTASLIAGEKLEEAGSEITIGAMFPRDDETALLLRTATAHAETKEWDAALECLEKAKLRMIDSSVHYPIETWCKLALYQSRAGRFEESMREFDWLLADLPRRARKESHMDDREVSFGRTSKKTIYNAKIRNGKRGIEEKRAVALRRLGKITI